jgi:hypothetical protein
VNAAGSREYCFACSLVVVQESSPVPYMPLSAMVNDCLKNCDAEIRKELCSNVLVVGGGSSFKGLSNRLSIELASLIPMVRARRWASLLRRCPVPSSSLGVSDVTGVQTQSAAAGLRGACVLEFHRRLHPVITGHVPAAVGLQAGVRRGGPHYHLR